MDAWLIVLYGAAGALALRCLAAQMTAHRRRLLREAADREQRRQKEEQDRIKAEKEKQKALAKRKKAPRSNAAA